MKIIKCNKKIVSGLLVIAITFSTLIGCSTSGVVSHEHTFASFWVTNDEYHWHPSTCGHDVQGDKERHEFTSETNETGETIYTCSICNYSFSDGNNDACTVTWENYDSTVLEVDEGVPYGATPTYDGAAPARESSGGYDYTFAGWSPEPGPVTGDTTYTAVFSSEEITYTIDFDLDGGTSPSYKGSIEVTAFSKDIFFFDCVKEDWQFRGWEYNGEKIFDEKGNQLKNVTLTDDMVFKAIYSQTFKLTITTNMPEAGTITGEGEYPYNTYVDVSASPYQGYEFVGWYYQSTLLSNEENYKYMMWDLDITLEARFEKGDFNLRIYTNNEDYGLVLLKSNSVIDDYLPEYAALKEYGSEVTIAAYSKSDVRFLGWYDENNNLVTTNAVYTFVMPKYDYTLEAKWNYFTINYNLNGGTNDPDNPNHYSIDDGIINLQDPTKDGYEFVAWKYNDEIIDAIDVNLVQDITLDAVWSSYEYEIKEDDNGKYAVIIGYDDSITDVIIPENIILSGEEIPVKEISQTAFKGNQKVKSITVSNKVTTIDEYAFAGCTSLESIYIPDSVTTIGSHAFDECSNLTIIYCEASSKPSGWDSSWNSSNRPVIWNSYKGIHGNLNGLEYTAYHDNEGNPYILITEYNGSDTDVVIPEYIEVNGEQIAVKEINDKAFYYNDTIKSVTIPDSVTTIGLSAFNLCSNLTTVTFGENSQLTSIGSSAFSYCSSLTSIYIPDSVTAIGGWAFGNCSSLTSIYIPDSVTAIGGSAFFDFSNLIMLTIYCEASSKPSGWDSSWNSGCPVVWNCISSFEISDEGLHFVVALDENGDKYITIAGYTGSSTNVVIPSSINFDGEDIPVKAIASNAFYNNDTITSITIPDSVTSIGYRAFHNCSNLTICCEASSKPSGWDYQWNSSKRPVVWSSNGQYGEYDGFIYGVSIDSEGNPYITIAGYTGSSTNVVIPSSINVNGEDISVKAIAVNAFYDNNTIASIIIPDSVTAIGDAAFYDCSSLTSIYIPDSVTTIGGFAFFGCSSLASIYIPDSVTTIGDLAFRCCSNLTTVTFGENSQLTSIGSSAFYDCSSLTSIYIPDSVTAIGGSAFSDCSSLTSIYIPDSVTTIGESAFYNCSKLTIYCEASSEPSGWDSSWNFSDLPVVWNCTYDEYLEAIA